MPRAKWPTVEEIERELAELERRRDGLDRAIARLRRIVDWLRRRRATMRRQGTTTPQSLTTACRAVLRMKDRDGATPREVKQLLGETGLDWSRYANPMAAVHTILKRLVQQGEATAVVAPDGERRFIARRATAIAVDAAALQDEAFVRALLEAASPDEILTLVRTRSKTTAR